MRESTWTSRSTRTVVLLGRTDTPGTAGEQEAAQLTRCFEHAGATFAAYSTDEDEAEAVFTARRLAYPALERLRPVRWTRTVSSIPARRSRT